MKHCHGKQKDENRQSGHLGKESEEKANELLPRDTGALRHLEARGNHPHAAKGGRSNPSHNIWDI